MILHINSDGGSRGNPGHSASAFIVKDEKGNEIFKWSKYLGIRTNNQAEYMAVVMAMKWLEQYKEIDKIEKVIHYLDSELIAKQIGGEYKIKSKQLVPYFKKIQDLKNSFKFTYSFKHVLRNLNSEADYLVNEALDSFSDSRK